METHPYYSNMMNVLQSCPLGSSLLLHACNAAAGKSAVTEQPRVLNCLYCAALLLAFTCGATTNVCAALLCFALLCFAVSELATRMCCSGCKLAPVLSRSRLCPSRTRRRAVPATRENGQVPILVGLVAALHLPPAAKRPTKKTRTIHKASKQRRRRRRRRKNKRRLLMMHSYTAAIQAATTRYQ